MKMRENISRGNGVSVLWQRQKPRQDMVDITFRRSSQQVDRVNYSLQNE